MRIAILFFCFLSSLVGYTQHSTLRFTDELINLNQQSLLLVPVESKMYLSDINKELAEENQLNSQEIVNRFILALDQSFRYTFQEKCKLSSFYNLEDEESQSDLKYIYDNVKLEYELVSATESSSKFKKITNKLSKKEDETYHRGELRDGQIYTKRDDRERYIKAVVEDKKMLDSMHIKFDNKFFLFANQLDIKNVYSDAISMQRGEYEREIKLHYTLYHQNGEILSTGISRVTFPASLNDIDEIISRYFPILANHIYEDLFPSEENNTKSKIDLKLWK